MVLLASPTGPGNGNTRFSDPFPDGKRSRREGSDDAMGKIFRSASNGKKLPFRILDPTRCSRTAVDENGRRVYLDAMYPSNMYAKRIAALEKHRFGLPEAEQIARVRSAFLESVPQIPRELAEDLFDEVMDGSREKTGAADPIAAAYRLGTYVDLFAMEFDDRNEPLSDREWRGLGDAVSAWAAELDMEIVSYIMQHIMERGLL